MRQTIRKISLMLGDDTKELSLVDIDIQMDTLSRVVRALAALQNT